MDYYKDEDDVRSKFLSYYYMGRVHTNGERYLQTTSCLMESEQLVEEVGDDYLSGLLYSEMGHIYRLYYDYPKSLEAYQKAAENRTDSANLCIVAAEVYSLQGKGEAAYRELLKGVVYQRRLRLRSEIESSECLHKELYLRLLGK